MTQTYRLNKLNRFIIFDILFQDIDQANMYTNKKQMIIYREKNKKKKIRENRKKELFI